VQTAGRTDRFDVSGRCERVHREDEQQQELQTDVPLNDRLYQRIQTVSNDTRYRAARLPHPEVRDGVSTTLGLTVTEKARAASASYRAASG
jgi:hypothetical protein